MKQIVQHLSSGLIEVIDTPIPQIGKNHILSETKLTLISPGTERMLADFGRSNLLAKALKQPDRVKEVLNKVSVDGMLPTYQAVKSKLDVPIPLGYCNVGTVLKSTSKNFLAGERVVSNGYHSSIVNVSQNLCARIPENVSDEEASFTILGAIALQGVRLSNPTIGENVVVIGLGPIGLITVQILLANGCNVLALDKDKQRLELANGFGAKIFDLSSDGSLYDLTNSFSEGYGIDAVIIAASTSSNQTIDIAARMSRKRGRIVLVGVVGLKIDRSLFYEKELTFQVSCSYGPGRYDENYEKYGNDYPIGFVRWTENRNFIAFLNLLEKKKIDIRPLLSHRFEIDDAPIAYETLLDKKNVLGIILSFSNDKKGKTATSVTLDNKKVKAGHLTIGFIGAGNYPRKVLLPIFKRQLFNFKTIVSQGGVSSTIFGKKFGFQIASSNENSIFSDINIGSVVIATRHDSHSKFVLKALKTGKHIFCEKPLCLSLKELKDIKKTSKENPHLHLMVGFNRRFAPLVGIIKKRLMNQTEPKAIVITANVGFIDEMDWTQDRLVGGGRIIGEACHFIDLARFLVGKKIVSSRAISFGKNSNLSSWDDKAQLTLTFEDGSFATINYLANGAKRYPKEKIQVFVAGSVFEIDNFKSLSIFGNISKRKIRSFSQDKGQSECIKAFKDSLRSGSPAIPLNEIFETAEIAIKLSKEALEFNVN